MLLDGKVALVTGAARNVGKGIAIRFAREGTLVIANDVDGDALGEMIKSANCGERILPAVCDVTDRDAVREMMERIERDHGGLDVLVNNAVIHVDKGERGPFLKVTAEGWRAFMSANLDALFFPTQGAARVMAKKRRGSIINISSNGAAAAHRQRIAYDSWKGAMEAFTRAVAVDLAPWGIRVNAVRPCVVADEAPAGSAEAARQKRLGEMIPMGRIARPADVAWACCYLAADDAAFVTGQVWNIDGGMLEQSRPPQMELEPVVKPEDMER